MSNTQDRLDDLTDEELIRGSQELRAEVDETFERLGISL